jgi:tetratricopeptide (TPR) repeat protein
MTERYQRLYALPQELYCEGSPLIVEAGALLWDRQLGRILAQLKLRNLGEKALRGARVEVQPLDLAERPLGGPVSYDYLDLNAGRGSAFGVKSPIVFDQPLARGFRVSVREVVFADRSVWQCEGEWKPVPRPETLENALGEELSREYRMLYGWNSRFFPRLIDGLWQCACGTEYPVGPERCPVCGRPSREVDANAMEEARNARLETVRSAVEAERLRKEEEARLAAEQEAREEEERRRIAERWEAEKRAEYARMMAEQKAEQERQEAERLAEQERQEAERLAQQTAPAPVPAEANVDAAPASAPEPPSGAPTPPVAAPPAPRKKKRLWILPLVLLLLAGIGAGIWFYGLPLYRYQAADKLAESDPLAAAERFEALGEYKDAAQRAEELRSQAAYEQAEALLAEGKYGEAVETFAALGEYRDAMARAGELKELEERYQEALAAERQGNLGAAAAAYAGLGEYRDSALRAEALLEQVNAELVPLEDCKAGDLVGFGAWEQDGDESNGKEPIVWIVLRRKGDQVLLLSRDCLASMPFQKNVKQEVSWENSDLREWLNNSFYNTAFVSFAEGEAKLDYRSALISTIVTSQMGGSVRSVHDKVFLLSEDNVQFYLIDKLGGEGMDAFLTPAAARMTGLPIGERLSWWLCSPLMSAAGGNLVSVIPAAGEGIEYTDASEYCGVRPAVWVDLSKLG